jgi:25S rRNA (uracil2634-N3)-methyltransferase
VKNIRAHQALVGEFLKGALPLLGEEGVIHITIKKGEPYESWRIGKIGMETEGMRVKNSFDFDPAKYPAYAHRRTIGFVEGR